MLLALTGVPALIQLLSLPFFPESPRYTLIQRGDEETARQGTEARGCSPFPSCPTPPKMPSPSAQSAQLGTPSGSQSGSQIPSPVQGGYWGAATMLGT